MNVLNKLLKQALNKREAAGNLRSLPLLQGLQDFCSNDYLGLARNPYLAQAIREREDNADFVQNGATGSRLLSGNSQLALSVEKRLARLFKTEAALVFGSGYAANTAVLSSVPQKGDTILLDELCHASLTEGAQLSFAKKQHFPHNNTEALKAKILRSEGTVFVVAESVYSMDGDIAPIADLVAVCNETGAVLILDEAHSTGIWGPAGSGLACSLGLEQHIPVRIHTFGKAMGVHGACVAGSGTLIEYLVNFARPFIYSTGLPPHSYTAIDCAFYYLSLHPEQAKKLHARIAFFQKTAEEAGLGNRFLPGSSPIKIFLVPGNENARAAAAHLQKAGFDVRPVLAPTVAVGAERLRICLHTYNTETEIKQLLSVLAES